MTELREKVARALCRELDYDPDKLMGFTDNDGNYDFRTMWTCYTGEADAAIRVCREHFAGVAETVLDAFSESKRSRPTASDVIHMRAALTKALGDAAPAK